MHTYFAYLFYKPILHSCLPLAHLYGKHQFIIKSEFMTQFFSITLCSITVCSHSRLTSVTKLIIGKVEQLWIMINTFFGFSNSFAYLQKQPSVVVLIKRCSENMWQIYKRPPMSKCDFNKVAEQFYWNHSLACVFCWKFAGLFSGHIFLRTRLDGCFCTYNENISSYGLKNGWL